MSCNSLTLEEQEAQNLINQNLNLPKTFSIEIGQFSFSESHASQYYSALLDQGFLYKTDDNPYTFASEIEVNKEKSAPYFLGRADFGKFTFKKYDIGFDAIQSISIDKEEKIARVAFTLKYMNIPPYTEEAEKAKEKRGEYSYINLNKKISVKLEF